MSQKIFDKKQQLNIGSGYGLIRHQAITRGNVKPNLCTHMAALGHNKLIITFRKQPSSQLPVAPITNMD